MPDRDPRARALAWAGYLRSVRASVCEHLDAGSLSLAEVLDARSTPAVGEIALSSVLESLPGARRIDTRRALETLGVSGRTPLAGLTEEQLHAVSDHFGAPTDGSTGE